MNKYYIPEWWYQTFLVIIFAFAVLALVAFIIYKKKVNNKIDRLRTQIVRLLEANERLHSNDIHENIITTVHPTRTFTAKCQVDTTNEIKSAQQYCTKLLLNDYDLIKFIDWEIEKDCIYSRPIVYARLTVVEPGKTKCDDPTKCHKCDKIMVCNYWRR